MAKMQWLQHSVSYFQIGPNSGIVSRMRRSGRGLGLETTGGGITESTDTAEIMTGDGDQSRSAVCSAAEIRCVG